jgi:YVTN family beta-propeller protein
MFSSIRVLVLVSSILMITPIVVTPAMTSASAPSVSTLGVASFPISLGYNPSNGYVYAGSFNGSVSVISGTSVIGSISSSDIGYTAQSFTYDPSNQKEYVAGGDGVSIISGLSATADITNAGSTSQTLIYDPSHAYVYVANLGSIAILTSDNGLKGNVAVNPRPGGFAFDAFDNYTYASYVIQNTTGSETGTELYVLAGANLVGNVTLEGGMGGFVAPVYDACHDYVYLANTSLGSVSVIWGATVVGEVPVGQGPASLAYDPANNFVYVANYNAGTVSVLSGTNLMGTVTVGSSPVAVAYNPYDGNMYVANENSGTVSVISGSTLVTTIPVGKDPVALVYDASNNDVYVANNGGASVSVITPLGSAGASSSSQVGCSPVPAGLITTTTVTTTATTTITSDTTLTTTLTNTTRLPPVTTTSTSTSTSTSTTTETSTSIVTLPPTTTTTTSTQTMTTTVTTTGPSAANPTTAGGSTTPDANTVTTATTSHGGSSTTSGLPLSAFIVLPIFVIVAFLGGILAGKRRAPKVRAPQWDTPV